MELKREPFEITVHDLRLLDQAQIVGSQVVNPSPSLAPFVFTLLSSLPEVNARGKCFSYRILQKSLNTVSHNVIDLEHIGVEEGGGLEEEPGPDEILGHMIGAELASIPGAPPIPHEPVPLKIYGVLYKRRAVVRQIISDILNRHRDWRISMEVVRNVMEDAVLWGKKFVPVKEALADLVEIARQDRVGSYQGKSVALAIGGSGEGDGPTSVYFWGAGITLRPAAPTKILALAASAGPHSEIVLKTKETPMEDYQKHVQEQWKSFPETDQARWISVAEENQMPDSHFLWVRHEKTGNKAKDRKLPYKWPDGRLSRPGLRGAWNVLHGGRGGADLQGGPSKEEMINKCRRAIQRYNREHPDDAITISEDKTTQEKGGVMKEEDIQKKIDEAVAAEVAKVREEFKDWVKPEDVDKKVEAAVASVKADFTRKEKRQRTLTDAGLKPSLFSSVVDAFSLDKDGDTAFDGWLEKMTEWGKKVTDAGLELNDVRWGIIASFKANEEFTAWLDDLKGERLAAAQASIPGGPFRPDTAGGSSGSDELPKGAH